MTYANYVKYMNYIIEYVICTPCVLLCSGRTPADSRSPGRLSQLAGAPAGGNPPPTPPLLRARRPAVRVVRADGGSFLRRDGRALRRTSRLPAPRDTLRRNLLRPRTEDTPASRTCLWGVTPKPGAQ